MGRQMEEEGEEARTERCAPPSLVPTPRRRLETEREVPGALLLTLNYQVNYDDFELEELVVSLRGSTDLEVQGDILHHLAATLGMHFQTGLGSVHDLLKELYDSACSAKHWSIVRHTSGLLGKRIPNIALSLTDLLVRQKQVTVGLPPHHEVILAQPLGSAELCALISRASAGDMAAATLSQEILVYLAMFARTEPKLFSGMLRLRVGLILQVMVSEFSRSLPGISGEEATDRLLNLSPFETKNLVHHLLAGQEYRVVEVEGRVTLSTEDCGLARWGSRREGEGQEEEEDSQQEEQREGLWLRRRLLDGSLNRVPPNFYTRMWGLLDRCQGLELGGALLPSALTQEMTSGEMAFHLRCEALLNSVPEPEVRQLAVEALLMLVLVVEHGVAEHLGGVIRLDELVREANRLFLLDQSEQGGEAVACCVLKPGQCGAAGGLCVHFFDSAPSGPWGTLAYLVRATCATINCVPEDGQVDCAVM